MQQLRVLSMRMIHFDGDIQSDRRNHLIDGRWFIACQSGQRIVLYDTYNTYDAYDYHPTIGKTLAAPPTVLWEQSNQIVRWFASTGTYREGRWVVYVWVQCAPAMHYCSILELGWDADSGSLCDTIAFDVPCDPSFEGLWADEFDHISRVFSSATPCFKSSRFLYLPGDPGPRLVFDTTTRIFYTVPPFQLALNQTRSSIRAVTQEPGYDTKLTNTHVIFLHHYSGEDSDTTRKFIVAQAFTVPDDQLPFKMLRLTHEGVFESQNKLLDIDVIRNSVVDSLTGSVNVRLLERSRWERAADDLYCIDLTLHLPSATDVLPMTITRQNVDIQSFIPVKGTTMNDKYWDISDKGYARCLSRAKYADRSTPTCLAKLAIDASGDRCMAFYGGELEEGPHSPHNEVCKLFTEYRLCVSTLDGTRGRFYGNRDRCMFVVDVE